MYSKEEVKAFAGVILWYIGNIFGGKGNGLFRCGQTRVS